MQTLRPYEVIVVLDRCTDNTSVIVAKFPYYLKIIEKNISQWKNSYTENLEIARNCVNGNVYAIIDGDVYLSSDYFEKTTKLLESEETVLVTGRVVSRLWNPNFLSRVMESWEKILWISPSITHLFFGCALIVRTQFLDNINGFEDVPSPDTYIHQQAYLRKFKLKFVKDTTAFHFDDNKSLRGIINSQIEDGKRRRANGFSFMRTVLYAILRLRPFAVSGWLTAFCREEKKQICENNAIQH
jgi:glycosyltransferase involved in cell wall biosynthesis